MENPHHTVPHFYGLTTRLETISLHGILEDPRAGSSHRYLTVYIDNIVQWESSIRSSNYSWQADSPLNFAASSNIRIELSSPRPSLAVVPGASVNLGDFNGRVIEFLDSHIVDIGIEGKIQCMVQLASVHCINSPTSRTHDNSSEEVMCSLQKIAENILTVDAMERDDVRIKIVQSCHFTISVCKLLNDEAHDERILDLAELLYKLYKAVRSRPNAFVKAVAREGLQVASLLDKYGRLPLENRDLEGVEHKYMRNDLAVVRARCEILMKDLNAG